MAPYLVVNREYCSAVGVGKNDLFWKMNLLLPLGNKYTNLNNPTRQIQIQVYDKDMFFDDYIGSAVVQVPFFDM